MHFLLPIILGVQSVRVAGAISNRIRESPQTNMIERTEIGESSEMNRIEQTEIGESSDMNIGNAKVMKYKDLKKATNNFKKELGRGGFGRVYEGKLKNGQMVAVKVLMDHDKKVLEQFLNEVMVLSRIRHKNLVSLFGCTSPRNRELLLVYELVDNGTVADHLHNKLSYALTLTRRIQIAAETADALAHLHAQEPPIIHRDVKTSNILLDHNFEAKVADLGICRFLPWDAKTVSTVPQGTMGYRDPEYDEFLRVSTKTDVYSFGVVLMELISGQQAVDVTRDPQDIFLHAMVSRKIKEKKLMELVDPKLGYHSNENVKRMVDVVVGLATECLRPEGDLRPTMAQVHKALKILLWDEYYKSLGSGRGLTEEGSSGTKFSLTNPSELPLPTVKIRGSPHLTV